MKNYNNPPEIRVREEDSEVINKRNFNCPPNVIIPIYSMSDFSEYSKHCNKISKFLNEENKRLEDLFDSEITSRIINHWQSEELISENRSNIKGWRRFSYIDLVWIHIIKELRVFGFTLENIKKIRKFIFIPQRGIKSPAFGLEFYMVLCCANIPCSVVIFPDCTVQFATHSELEASYKCKLIGTHLNISLNHILQRIMPTESLIPKHNFQDVLSIKEKEILSLIRLGKYESVKIFFKTGKIDRIEKRESINVGEKIRKIIRDSAYQRIEVVVENNKVVSIKRDIKDKLML